jgi:hypothetical protein
MTTARVLPPGSGNSGTIGFQGRSYTCALGSTLDVDPAIAAVMVANGWINFGRRVSGIVLSGATAARPTADAAGLALQPGTHFLDTTLNVIVVWDGVNWRGYNGATA